ncbi:hypothetical protein [Cryobacterium sp. PAMC25264]|uniref:hypothetical protein n=1 Tax=Cryobacterium sp. PAMC25264 TaxID=2861288 RepID=UPI001C62C1CC|nr:hypothetical protein [Cryobacterium sp. PAMC25264]QYF74134.1 hypothetical protein KY500_02530 [Cryobacterium sp. PAMC25264]
MDDDRQPTADFPHGTAFHLEVFTPPVGASPKHLTGVPLKHLTGASPKHLTGVSPELAVPLDGEHGRPKAPKSIKNRAIPDQYKYRSKKKRPGAKTFNGEVYGYICQLGADLVNDSFHLQGSPLMPTHDELATYLLKILESQFDISSLYDFSGTKTPSTLTDSDAAGMADRAAAFTLREWDPYYYTKKSMAGSIGGSRSKPRPRLTVADLRRVDGMTKAEAAKKLKTSTATIGRLRAKQRDRPSFN